MKNEKHFFQLEIYMKAFINPHDPDNIALKKTLTEWLKTKLALNDDTEVSIHEHLCSEPSCVHAETVFRTENNQEISFYKITKPIVYVRKWDLDGLKKIDMPTVHTH
jgi:hypothetical protein